MNIKIEGISGEAKSHDGLRKAPYRGTLKLQIQVYVVTTVILAHEIVEIFSRLPLIKARF